jgi:ADP-heptose:LPS heptosyltransferase
VVDLRGSAISGFLRRQRRAVYRRSSGPAVHKVIEAARVLRIEDDPPAPYLYTSPQTEALADELTAGVGPILALAPSANWVGKTWPLERFAQAAIQLLGEGGPMAGGRLMVLGGPEDAHVVQALRHVVHKDRFIRLIGKADLLTSYACLKRARLFVGNDSGLMHLAAAAGVPTLGLFGPSDDRLYSPWGPAAALVRGPRSFDQIQADNQGRHQELCHMMDLTVEAVVAAASKLHAHTEPSHA